MRRPLRKPSRTASRVPAPGPASLLPLIWLASPALPIGGFSYSEGLEAAVDAGLVHAIGDLIMHIAMPDLIGPIDMGTPPLDLRRAEVERSALGYTYAEVGAGMAEKWQFPPEMVSALANQIEPFEGEAYDRLGGILNLASWRARAEEIQLDDQGLAATFPDMVGLTLGLDLDSVLGKDPSEWSFSQALGAFMD